MLQTTIEGPDIVAGTASSPAPRDLYRALQLLVDASKHLGGNHMLAHEHISQARDLLQGALVSPTARGGLAPWQARKVAIFIEGNLQARIRTIDLARQINLSSRYFSEAFRISFGLRPQAYILSRRLEQAKKLMATTENPLCEISLACGMADQSHLSRVFRAHFGRTPNYWRREHNWLKRMQADDTVGGMTDNS